MLNCDQRWQTSASLMDIKRRCSLEICAFPDFTMMQCNMAHVFLDCYIEAEDNISQILKEGAAVRRWRL